jgi:hypothetical protein
MHPQLTAIVAQLEEAQQRLHQLEARTRADRWAARADPGRWSVGECIAHLNLTSKAFLPRLRQAFADPKFANRSAPRRYRRDFGGWIVSLFVGDLPRIGGRPLGSVSTKAQFVPGGDLDREMVVAEFNTLQHELIQLTRAADGKPLDQMRIVSPFDARLSYNAYSCLVILPRHQQRHLSQAEHVWTAS